MTLSGEDLRQHPRFRLALQVVVDLPSGEVKTSTVGVSRTGLSLRLSPQPAIDEALRVSIALPDGRVVVGRGRSRAHMPGALVGLSLELDGKNQVLWDSFVDEEESTGSLWRMIGRIANAPDDAYAPRGIVASDRGAKLRFHTVGENGLAYRVAFSKHPSDPGDESDLCVRLPGFREPARRLVRRVLREDMLFRMDESADAVVVKARSVELNRGGWAWVQADEGRPVGLVALGVGELLQVERDGQTVFPHFTELELEQIACDTFRHDLARPAFSRATVPAPGPLGPVPPAAGPPKPVPPAAGPLGPVPPAAGPLGPVPPAPGPVGPVPVSLPPLASAPVAPAKPVDTKRFREGYDAVRFAQAAAAEVQVRKYGDRDIFFHPSVWAKVKDDDGTELMGPTLQDGGRLCVLALVGPGTPRVIKLHEGSTVSLLKPPRT